MVWDATYSAHGKTARFRLELVVIPPKEKGLFVPGSGCIYHVAGSESGGLLADLKPILGAKRVPTVRGRVAKLSFNVAFLGVNQSRLPDTKGGGFTSNPPGDWMLVKVFLPGDVEFFFNINDKCNKAEFSLKDPDYGDDILKQLAKVL